MFNNKKNTPKEVDLIFDIRNSSVAIGVIEKDKNNKAISYTDRKYTNPTFVKDIKTFERQINLLLDNIIENFIQYKSKNNIKSVDKVYCVFSSPWYESEIKDFNFKEDKKTKFTEKYLKNRIEEVEENKEIVENKNFLKVEDDILSIYLNGYETKRPFNKKFKNAKLTLYRSFIEKDNSIKEKISEKINPNQILLHTHPFIILNVLKNNFHNIENFCLFDIGGEVTEVSIFKDGAYKELITIPIGFNSLIRKISKTENDEQINISRIKLINHQELEDDILFKEMERNIEKWFEEIRKIRDINNESLSKNIFIIVDRDFKKIIKNTFNKKEFYLKNLGLNNEPLIRFIDSIDNKGLALYNKDILRDPLISIIYNFSTIEF